MLVGAIPDRYKELLQEEDDTVHSYPIDTYFAMARGLQDGGHDISAMEMTKWFNTNYHYIVPEFSEDQHFQCLSSKIFDEFAEAKAAGFTTKPSLIGPVSFLLLGKEKNNTANFHRLDLLEKLLPVYQEILSRLEGMGAEWVQIEEPFLSLDITEKTQTAYRTAYRKLNEGRGELKLLLTTYFEGLGDNSELTCSLPVEGLHIDLVEAPDQLGDVLNHLHSETALSLGLIDGRNIWKVDLEKAADVITHAKESIGSNRLMIAPSSSLLHCPVNLMNETDVAALPSDVKRWMAFANQKLDELTLLKKMAGDKLLNEDRIEVEAQQAVLADKRKSKLVHNSDVQQRMEKLNDDILHRDNSYTKRKKAQRKHLDLPELFPTTTIGSFPQTDEVRRWRADYRKGKISQKEYEQTIKKAIDDLLDRQEEIGLDMLVHGEFERNDMVEYFGQHFAGFAFTRHGWVQSYGTRAV